MAKTVIKIYGYRGMKNEVMAAADLDRKMKETLRKTKSERDGRPLLSRVTIVFVTSLILTSCQEGRKYYIEVLADESYDAHEVVQAFSAAGLEIAENAIFIKTHNVC